MRSLIFHFKKKEIDMTDYFRVGVYSTTHGVKGEIKVFPTTDDINRFEDIKTLYMDVKGKYLPFEVDGVKYFKNQVILHFKGVDNINDIEKYKGSDLYVSREDAIPLEEDEFYIADILGADVIEDNGNRLGELTDVLETGANLVYVVKREGAKDVLIPGIKECILDVDVENKVLKVHLLEGLL